MTYRVFYQMIGSIDLKGETMEDVAKQLEKVSHEELLTHIYGNGAELYAIQELEKKERKIKK